MRILHVIHGKGSALQQFLFTLLDLAPVTAS
jgi:hypothetical protein